MKRVRMCFRICMPTLTINCFRFENQERDLFRLEVDILMTYIPGLVRPGGYISYQDFRYHSFVANYSFLRFYKDRKGVDDWKIRKLNHFNHRDEMKDRTY